MDFRTRRQITILFVAGLVFSGAIFLVVKSYLPAPTCFDGRRNQGEEQTDCGGPCLACALKDQKDAEVFWVRFVRSRDNTYDAAAELRNPNVKLAAKSFNYEFKLFDDTGFVVASRRGSSFIYPGETLHLAEIGLTSSRTVVKATLVLGDFDWVLYDGIGPDVIAGSREYVVEDRDGSRVSVVKALVANRTIDDVKNVAVTVLVFDQDGNLMGVNGTILDRIEAGGTKPVGFQWPGVLPKPVSTVLIKARSPVNPPNL